MIIIIIIIIIGSSKQHQQQSLVMTIMKSTRLLAATDTCSAAKTPPKSIADVDSIPVISPICLNVVTRSQFVNTICSHFTMLRKIDT